MIDVVKKCYVKAFGDEPVVYFATVDGGACILNA